MKERAWVAALALAACPANQGPEARRAHSTRARAAAAPLAAASAPDAQPADPQVVTSLPEVAVPAATEPDVPGTVDLAGLIACQKSMDDWSDLVSSYLDPGQIERWGWRKIESGSGFLSVFELPRSIYVFGQRTSQVAFSASGIVALLPEASWSAVLDLLKLDPISVGPTTKLYGRAVWADTHSSGSFTIVQKISYSVSTSDAYPGVVLAGCSYAREMRDTPTP